MGRFSLNGVDTDWVAISLERTSACNLHVGILYRDANRRLFKLHFGWHRFLANTPSPVDACVIPDIDEGQADKADGEWIAGFCERIAGSSRNQSIPYNLKYDESIEFDDVTGDIFLGPTSTGLSCATFVLAVLRSSGNALIDVASYWPPATGEERTMQLRFVNMMLDDKRPDTQNQGRLINSEIGTPRVRPDHVAGAGLEPHSDWPVRHEQCQRNAALVVASLDGT